MHYLTDFLALGIARLVGYFTRHHKPSLRRCLLRGELLLYWGLALGLALVNLPAALALLVLPVLLSRVVMMLGNWAQHAFIDPTNPGNCYTIGLLLN